jgi:hypothetical protein
VLKHNRSAADPRRMWEGCRYCGSREGRALVLVEGELACPRCAGSPLCDCCGHPRGRHTGVYDKSARSCKYVWFDVPSLSKITCDCAGFAPVTGALADAGFANAADDDTPLRIAPRN